MIFLTSLLKKVENSEFPFAADSSGGEIKSLRQSLPILQGLSSLIA